MRQELLLLVHLLILLSVHRMNCRTNFIVSAHYGMEARVVLPAPSVADADELYEIGIAW